MPPISDRIGVCSWSLRPSSDDDLVAKVRQVGLGKVQLALNAHRGESGAQAETIRRLRDAGVTVASGMFGATGEDYSTLQTIQRTGGLALDENWDANLAIARRSAALAAEHGIPRVSFHAGFIPHDAADPAYAKLRDRIRQAADVFAEQDVRLLFETGQETADGLVAFLDDLDHAGVGVNFDPANMILYDKGDPVEALRLLLPRVEQVHIKDAVRTKTPGEWGTEVPVGTGEVDWPAFVGVLNDGGYAGDLIIEREAGENRVEDVATAAAHLTALM